jgi:Ion channel
MEKLSSERRALFLLCTLVAFIVLVPLLEGRRWGEFFLVISMFLTLSASTMEVGGRRQAVLRVATLAGVSMVLIIADYLMQSRASLVSNHLMLAIFFAVIVARLFSFLGKPGEITNGRLYVSVSLYFLLAIFWYAIFTLVNALQPGSYADTGVALGARTEPSKLLYFSLVTLTTLGYGDVVAVRPLARILATMEAATGVLFVAITVARLVGAQQTANSEGR